MTRTAISPFFSKLSNDGLFSLVSATVNSPIKYLDTSVTEAVEAEADAADLDTADVCSCA